MSGVNDAPMIGSLCGLKRLNKHWVDHVSEDYVVGFLTGGTLENQGSLSCLFFERVWSRVRFRLEYGL